MSENKETFYIRQSDCRDIGWAYEIDGSTYKGNLIIEKMDKPLVVEGDQVVEGYQVVKGDQIVKGYQGVEGYQVVEGYQTVKGDQTVEGYQVVEGDQIVKGDQTVEGDQIVKGYQGVEGYQIVKGDQTVEGYQVVEGDQAVKGGKALLGQCKYAVFYKKLTIKIGYKEKTTKEWEDFFASNKVYETPRESFAFNQIYKAFLMAKVAQETDKGLV